MKIDRGYNERRLSHSDPCREWPLPFLFSVGSGHAALIGHVRKLTFMELWHSPAANRFIADQVCQQAERRQWPTCCPKVTVARDCTTRLAHGLQRLVLLESVYRFKGQAAPAIIFAEIDFDVLDEKAVRKLFVGATLSMMKLVLVLHETAASQLLGRMD
jgi:hypothetical protein